MVDVYICLSKDETPLLAPTNCCDKSKGRYRLISNELDVDAILCRFWEALFGVDKKDGAVQPAGSPNIVLIGFGYESNCLRLLTGFV